MYGNRLSQSGSGNTRGGGGSVSRGPKKNKMSRRMSKIAANTDKRVSNKLAKGNKAGAQKAALKGDLRARRVGNRLAGKKRISELKESGAKRKEIRGAKKQVKQTDRMIKKDNKKILGNYKAAVKKRKTAVGSAKPTPSRRPGIGRPSKPGGTISRPTPVKGGGPKPPTPSRRVGIGRPQKPTKPTGKVTGGGRSYSSDMRKSRAIRKKKKPGM